MIVIDGDLTLSNAIYQIPIALKNIQIGDIIIHNTTPMVVTAIKSNALICIDIAVGEEKRILPAENAFGFTYVTKLICPIADLMKESATEDTPFGNLLPYLLTENNTSNNEMLLYWYLNKNADSKIDPMLLLSLGNKNDALLTWLLMEQKNKKED